ncbi:MAG TPA: hypothetical protein VLL57_02110, partial [Candidatus Binataceae bacterium]|nr:hypothetical protein [Candidatus Binataceae bacterium]
MTSPPTFGQSAFFGTGGMASEAEQDVKADAEQAPNQDAVDRRWRKSEVGQDEGGGDQARRRQSFDNVGALLNHRRPLSL